MKDKFKFKVEFFQHDINKIYSYEDIKLEQHNKNVIEYIIYGLRRSGNHAIIYWLAHHLPNGAYHWDNIPHHLTHDRHFESKTTPFGNKWPKRRKILFINNGSIIQIKNKDEIETYQHIICSYEDAKLEQYNKDARYVLILRDPYNTAASRIQRNHRERKCRDTPVDNNYIQNWISYAEEFIGETKTLGNNIIKINYNTWCKSEKYRRKIITNLGFTFTDIGYKKVPKAGHGSSFDRLKFDGKANEMDTSHRWKNFTNNEQWQKIYNNETIKKLSDKIFGKIT